MLSFAVRSPWISRFAACLTIFTVLRSDMAMAEPPASSLRERDLDLTATKVWHDGKEVTEWNANLPGVMGFLEGQPHHLGWAGGGVRNEDPEATYVYRLAFRQPVSVGSLFVAGTVTEVAALKPDAKYPGDPTDESDWKTITFPARQAGARLVALPDGFTTRAFLFRDKRTGWSAIHALRLFRERLHNVTPAATAYAEREYTPPMSATSYTASLVTSARGEWQSAGKDQNGFVSVPAVSDVNPTWYMVTWPEPQTLSGFWSKENFTKIEVDVYVGGDEINPRVATEREWKRLKDVTQKVQGGRWVAFAPTTTRGVRIRILKTEDGGIAKMSGLQFFTPLGDKPAPQEIAPEETSPLPPKTVELTLAAAKDAKDGKRLTTFVIDTTDGRRVRNVFAREPMAGGKHSVGWDLKDESGNYVAPGDYAWQALSHEPFRVKYETTVYPNVLTNHPENSPWLNAVHQPGGWMADHTPPVSVCAVGDRVYLGSLVAESGVSFIECDLTGKKLWGHHSFAAWTGPRFLASDGKTVFVGSQILNTTNDAVWGVDVASKEVKQVLALTPTATRKRGMMGMAARPGELAISIQAKEDWLANAAAAEDADIMASIPLYPPKRKPRVSDDRIPDPQTDFLRLFRLIQHPSGGGTTGSLVQLQSQLSSAPQQHIVLAFKKPVPLGSVVLPVPNDGKTRLRLSVLKPNAPYPPDPEKAAHWKPFETHGAEPWDVVPAPPNTVTRALRITFQRGSATEDDPLAAAIDAPKGSDPLDLDAPTKPAKGADDLTGFGGGTNRWQGQIEGMKLLRRRFASLAATAKVTTNSGSINAVGEWDAERDRPITESDPGLYAMTWEKPQKVRGLAIKEIDGQLTKVDVWTGPAGTPPTIDAASGWTEIATYEQGRRDVGNGFGGLGLMNPTARYVDGYVDFGKEVETLGVRLRVVKQWADNGQAACLGVRMDRGGRDLDSKRCRVYGVAPVAYVGGEPPIDPAMNDRIEFYSIADGTLQSETSLPKPGEIAYSPDGALYAVSGTEVVKVWHATPSREATSSKDKSAPVPKASSERSPESPEPKADAKIETAGSDGVGKGSGSSGRVHATESRATFFVSDLTSPTDLAFDAKGNLYVFDAAPDRKVVRVYGKDGKYQRSIGTPGGFRAGAWNPTRLGEVTSIDVDSKGQLWIVENQYWPKRVTLWTTEGELVREFLGNTEYGGGGVLDPEDPTRVFYGPLEFEVDWKTGLSKLKNLTWLPGWGAGEVPLRVDGRQYLVTRPMFSEKPVGVVYLYDEGRLKRAAAVGLAVDFDPLKKPSLLAELGNPDLSKLRFHWSDLSGDGEVQADEVTLLPRPAHVYGVSNFNRDLSVQQQSFRYVVKKFLPSGVPVYESQEFPALTARTLYKLDAGHFHRFAGFVPERESGLTADGKELWSYPQEGFGVQALGTAKPWFPGQVVAQFGIVGHATAHAGDLGEFVVVHGNTGQWNVWTADGLLVGPIFKDLRTGPRTWSMEKHDRGMTFDDLTPGQEHFSGWFCRTKDDRYFAVAGHNHISLLEVLGLETAKRERGTLTVTADDLKKVQAWEQERQKVEVYARAPVADAFRLKEPPQLDGKLDDWTHTAATLEKRADLRLGYDDRYLYVAWQAHGLGPMKNSATKSGMLFKGGAAVDLQFATDPEAAEDRQAPVKGDKRLLLAFTDGLPQAVLYDAVVPGTPDEKAVHIVSPVGDVAFDRVESLKISGSVREPQSNGMPSDAPGLKPDPDRIVAVLATGVRGYVVEAAIPLSMIGLKPSENDRYRFDWGFLTTDDAGNAVLQRVYWANKATAVVADAPSEAQLNPHLWGHVRFFGVKASASDRLGEVELGSGRKSGKDVKKDVTDILGDLEEAKPAPKKK